MASVARDEEEVRGFPWLEAIVGICALALFLQLFPGVWWSVVSFAALVLSYVDAQAGPGGRMPWCALW